MINFIKSILNGNYTKILFLLFVSANLAIFAYQKYKILDLKSQNSELTSDLSLRNSQILDLNSQISERDKTIYELAENAKEKERLIAELSDLKQRLAERKGAENENINQNLYDSVNYILHGLQ